MVDVNGAIFGRYNKPSPRRPGMSRGKAAGLSSISREGARRARVDGHGQRGGYTHFSSRKRDPMSAGVGRGRSGPRLILSKGSLESASGEGGASLGGWAVDIAIIAV